MAAAAAAASVKALERHVDVHETTDTFLKMQRVTTCDSITAQPESWPSTTIKPTQMTAPPSAALLVTCSDSYTDPTHLHVMLLPAATLKEATGPPVKLPPVQST
jgi:phosphoribosylaminoimidazole carboxylase (NCAIR synthetase)